MTKNELSEEERKKGTEIVRELKGETEKIAEKMDEIDSLHAYSHALTVFIQELIGELSENFCLAETIKAVESGAREKRINHLTKREEKGDPSGYIK